MPDMPLVENEEVVAERRRNRRTLDEWISRRFWDPGQAELLSPNGSTLEFKFPANRGEGGGSTSLADAVVALDGQFEEWIESPIEVFETDDPTHFILYIRLAYGRLSNVKGHPLHESEFVLLYVIRHGAIELIREYFNPLQLLSAHGIQIDGVRLLADEDLPEHPFS